MEFGSTVDLWCSGKVAIQRPIACSEISNVSNLYKVSIPRSTILTSPTFKEVVVGCILKLVPARTGSNDECHGRSPACNLILHLL